MSAQSESASSSGHNGEKHQDVTNGVSDTNKSNDVSEQDKDERIAQLKAHVSELVAENERLRDSSFAIQRRQRADIDTLKAEKEELTYLLEQATQDFGESYTATDEDLGTHGLEEEVRFPFLNRTCSKIWWPLFAMQNKTLQDENEELKRALRDREMTLAEVSACSFQCYLTQIFQKRILSDCRQKSNAPG
eukprot:gb/GECG01001610.1/.p1 GENE.gb/GECG01001610.1/~~gb/GECG01001610.1/.p1  ORF type:complete len:191 (+),score=29.87 gb/GECG01001610.1/:1-573(+)